MIPRPTTDVLLQDCARELTEEILPALTDETLKLRLVMTATVLGNAAVRAANEIAWMLAEREELLGFARAVAEQLPDEPLAAALAAADSGTASLALHDVVAAYEGADIAFDAALRAAQLADAQAFLDRAAALLRARVDGEKRVMAGYAVVGR